MDFNTILNGAISAVNQSSSTMGAIGKMLADNTAQLQAMTTVNAAEGAQAIALSQQAAETKISADHATASIKERVQNVLNINPDVLENELQISTNALNAAQAEHATARKEYDSIAQTDMMSNPLSYIFGQLKLPSVAAKVNATIDAQETAQANIDARLTMAKKFGDIVVANNAGKIQDASLLQASAEAKMASVKLRHAEMENNSRIAGSLMNEATVADKISDNKVKIVSMNLQAASAEANREMAAASREQANALRAARVEAMAEKKESTDMWNLQLQRVEQFLKMPPSSLTVNTLKMFKPAEQQAIKEFAISNSLGADLPSALKTYANIPGKGNITVSNPGAAYFVKGISTEAEKYADALTAAAAKTGGAKIPPGQLGFMAIEDYQSDIINSANSPTHSKPLSSAAWDTSFNPYKAQHKVMLSEVASGVRPDLANNLVVKAMQTVAVNADQNLSNITAKEEQRALRVIRDAVAERKVTPQVAAQEIASYYRAAAGKNLENYQYGVFGLAPQTKYMYTMEATGLAGKTLKADLMNPATIERALMKDVRGITAIAQSGIGSLFGISTETQDKLAARDQELKSKGQTELEALFSK